MGTYTDLSIAGYSIISTKSRVYPVVMTIFRESDKHIFKTLIDDVVEVPWDYTNGEIETTTVYQYLNTAQNIKQRLDVMGFTLKRTRHEFERGISNRIEELEESICMYGEDGYNSEEAVEKSTIEESSFDDWLKAFHYILTKKLNIEYFEKPSETYPPLVRFILQSNDYEDIPLYRFPCNDIRYLLRTFLEVSDPNSLVIQDISNLVGQEYYNPEDKICESAIYELTADYPVNSKIVILTEGSTDKYILETSLKILYPHLYEYYSFMDFSSSNLAGGASSLVSTVKAFVGSGITNRIIAVFDNDTAASVARKGISRTDVPDNIKIVSYPDSKLAENYPTIGPTGISHMNINGLACSIELFLGVDILKQNGDLTPIQWKGYDESIQQYQGEILNKKKLQNAYENKVNLCIADKKAINLYDWDSMKLIWEHIFICFS